MKNADMLGADFTNTKLNNIDWGLDSKVINEIDAEKALEEGNHEKSLEKYKEAEDIYRSLKMSMQAQTLPSDIAFEFVNVDGFNGVSRVEFQEIILADSQGNSIEAATQAYDVNFTELSCFFINFEL